MLGVNYATVYPLLCGGENSWLGNSTAIFFSPTTVESLQFSRDDRYLALGPRYLRLPSFVSQRLAPDHSSARAVIRPEVESTSENSSVPSGKAAPVPDWTESTKGRESQEVHGAKRSERPALDLRWHGGNSPSRKRGKLKHALPLRALTTRRRPPSRSGQASSLRWPLLLAMHRARTNRDSSRDG